MHSDPPVPLWLWRIVTWGFGLALVGVIGLAAALSRGLADPPRAGPLVWYDDFKSGATRWEFLAPGGGTLRPTPGGLLAEFREAAPRPGQFAIGLTPGPAPGRDFTLEVAGTQTAGEIGAAYGLIFAWQDATHYSAVLVNGNGYAEAYRQAGAERRDWFKWQQWPNILVGTASNRVRVDVRGTHVTLRVNDEWLTETTAEAAALGEIGVIAHSAGPGQVVFSWVKVWAR